MTLHLKKLSVGAQSVEDLEAWRDHVVARNKAATGEEVMDHVTRMWPRRGGELLDGGSLYWVIKKAIRCRQRILDLREAVGEDGVKRCAIILDPEILPTEARRCRPFQGWRYLEPEAAPADAAGAAATGLPLKLRDELAELGLL
ncbi:MAG: DUF1489 domain-containing protein [Pseudomonadota bacterium]